VRFFASAAAFREWLDAHHATETEILVGFYKKGVEPGRMTYKEAVDEALCFGWIDGVRKGIDERSYLNRFTPRKRGSTWSAVNIARVAELAEQGRMHPAGQRAFDERVRHNDRSYSYENDVATLAPDLEQQFRSSAAAWSFFAAQAPSYQRTSIWWVMSAKRAETRERRLASLIEASAAGRRMR
jgi:uncharacterized protein YdeI (YjbR/CyaY-like superfamily)